MQFASTTCEHPERSDPCFPKERMNKHLKGFHILLEFMRKRVLVVSICSTAELDLPITVYAIVLHSALKSGVFPNMTQTKRNASWAKSSSSTWGLSGLFVLAVANLANEVLVVSPIKRHSSIDQGIQQHPKGPAVHLEETVISDSWH